MDKSPFLNTLHGAAAAALSADGGQETTGMPERSFDWNGVNSAQHGIVVLAMPPIVTPQPRQSAYVVPARSGTVYIPDSSYEEMLFSVRCYLPYGQGATVSSLETVRQWLRGSHWLRLSNLPEYMFRAQVIDQIAFTPWVEGFDDIVFTVVFRAEPFRYIPGGEDAEVVITGVEQPTEDGGEPTYSIGTMPALVSPAHCNYDGVPRITLLCSGDVAVTINETRVELTGVDKELGAVVLDSYTQEAWQGDTTLISGQITGAFPMLRPGTNTMQVEGNVQSFSITPNWRSL